MKQLKKSLSLIGVMAASLPLFTGCGQIANEKSRAAILGSISEAQWTAAAANPVVMNMGRQSNGKYEFRDSANRIDSNGPIYTFEVGKPYVFHLINKAETSHYGIEHYLSDYVTNQGSGAGAGIGGNTWSNNGFWSSVVVGKAVSRNTVFKAPFILDFELNKVRNLGGSTYSNFTGTTAHTGIGTLSETVVAGTASDSDGTTKDTQAWVYFVPVRTGSFTMWCSKGGSSHGVMRATINIVGEADKQPDFELESDFDSTYANSGERSSSNAVWTYQRTGSLGLAESGGQISMVATASNFDRNSTGGTWEQTERSGLMMTTNGTRRGYQFRVYKQEGDEGEFELASDLFRHVAIRKIHDVDVQFKPIYLESVTLRSGAGSTCGGLPSTVAGPHNSNCKSLNPDTGAVMSTFNASSNPGQGQVDLYIVPQADKLGSFDTTITSSNGAQKLTSWTVTSSLLQ